MNSYRMTIELDDETLRALHRANFKLFVFKGVKSSQGGGGLPVWYCTDRFSRRVTFFWEERYGAYLSSSEIDVRGRILLANETEMRPGELVSVDEDGTLSLSSGGVSDAISLCTKTNQNREWTCGMMQSVNGALAPTCAFSLYGGGFLDVMVPWNRILLFFGPASKTAGDLVYYTREPALLVNCEEEGSELRAGYGINTGWDTFDQAGMSTYPVLVPLSSLLILPSDDLVRERILWMNGIGF